MYLAALCSPPRSQQQSMEFGRRAFLPPARSNYVQDHDRFEYTAFRCTAMIDSASKDVAQLIRNKRKRSLVGHDTIHR